VSLGAESLPDLNVRLGALQQQAERRLTEQVGPAGSRASFGPSVTIGLHALNVMHAALGTLHGPWSFLTEGRFHREAGKGARK
jgi:hypothetical protein